MFQLCFRLAFPASFMVRFLERKVHSHSLFLSLTFFISFSIPVSLPFHFPLEKQFSVWLTPVVCLNEFSVKILLNIEPLRLCCISLYVLVSHVFTFYLKHWSSLFCNWALMQPKLICFCTDLLFSEMRILCALSYFTCPFRLHCTVSFYDL